jgi:hypothetical protein
MRQDFRIQCRGTKYSTVTVGIRHLFKTFRRMFVKIVCSPLFYRPAILRLMISALRVVETQALPIIRFLECVQGLQTAVVQSA